MYRNNIVLILYVLSLVSCGWARDVCQSRNRQITSSMYRSVSMSSTAPRYGRETYRAENGFDGNRTTFLETNSSGREWVFLEFKNVMIVKKLTIEMAEHKDDYLNRINVFYGIIKERKKLCNIGSEDYCDHRLRVNPKCERNDNKAVIMKYFKINKDGCSRGISIATVAMHYYRIPKIKVDGNRGPSVECEIPGIPVQWLYRSDNGTAWRSINMNGQLPTGYYTVKFTDINGFYWKSNQIVQYTNENEAEKVNQPSKQPEKSTKTTTKQLDKSNQCANIQVPVINLSMLVAVLLLLVLAVIFVIWFCKKRKDTPERDQTIQLSDSRQQQGFNEIDPYAYENAA